VKKSIPPRSAGGGPDRRRSSFVADLSVRKSEAPGASKVIDLSRRTVFVDAGRRAPRRMSYFSLYVPVPSVASRGMTVIVWRYSENGRGRRAVRRRPLPRGFLPTQPPRADFEIEPSPLI